MNDKQQIEEIFKIVSINCGECYTCKFNDMRRFGNCTDYLITNELYKQGYRKIPENAVVLTREEWEKDFSSQFNKGYEKGSKETAREIIHYMRTEIVNYLSDSELDEFNTLDVQYLAKKYGVEVEE